MMTSSRETNKQTKEGKNRVAKPSTAKNEDFLYLFSPQEGKGLQAAFSSQRCMINRVTIDLQTFTEIKKELRPYLFINRLQSTQNKITKQ